MSENNLESLDLGRIMRDNGLIRGDVSHAAGMVRSMFTEKYIAPIARAFDAQSEHARKNPSRETRLLEAIKPFLNNGRQGGIDRAVEMLRMAEAMQGLKKNLNIPAYNRPPVAAAAMDNSIRADGVYDVDCECMEKTGRSPGIAPIMMAMMLMNLQKK